MATEMQVLQLFGFKHAWYRQRKENKPTANYLSTSLLDILHMFYTDKYCDRMLKELLKIYKSDIT